MGNIEEINIERRVHTITILFKQFLDVSIIDLRTSINQTGELLAA